MTGNAASLNAGFVRCSVRARDDASPNNGARIAAPASAKISRVRKFYRLSISFHLIRHKDEQQQTSESRLGVSLLNRIFV
jgi:hypothetical protein